LLHVPFPSNFAVTKPPWEFWKEITLSCSESLTPSPFPSPLLGAEFSIVWLGRLGEETGFDSIDELWSELGEEIMLLIGNWLELDDEELNNCAELLEEETDWLLWLWEIEEDVSEDRLLSGWLEVDDESELEDIAKALELD
jgi:hypothetical protein